MCQRKREKDREIERESKLKREKESEKMREMFIKMLDLTKCRVSRMHRLYNLLKNRA